MQLQAGPPLHQLPGWPFSDTLPQSQLPSILKHDVSRLEQYWTLLPVLP
jgi:hypothetical protein